MSVTFDRAPLVEIICELRWPQQVATALDKDKTIATPFVVHKTGGQNLDDIFHTFSGEIYQKGYKRVERLNPPGTPVLAHHPLYRYRSEDPDFSSTLFQIGAGLFSANATPPYRSWKSFSPVVRSGVEALSKAIVPASADFSFSGLSLRYIDAFDSELRNGLSIEKFISEVLGFSTSLPPSFKRQNKNDAPEEVFLQFSVPLGDNIILTGATGRANVKGETVALLDMTATLTKPIPSNTDAVMDKFNTCRNLLHTIFIDSTHSIKNLMKPKED